MRSVLRFTLLGMCFGLLGLLCTAQEPRDNPGDAPKRAAKKTPASSSATDSVVSRMMAFDKNKDGKLSRDEITDRRLLRLFDRADKDKDGVVTKEELSALAKQMADEEAADDDRRGGFGPPGGPGGPGGFRGPGGPPPQPGQLLPPFLQERLQLTDKQKEQLEELQKQVDRKLDQILTAEQKKQLKEMRPPGPGGRGPGGRGPDDDPPR
jgi:hypothetical protein